MESTFLFEHVSDAIVIVDTDFRIVNANPSFHKFFNLNEKQQIDKDLCSLFRGLNLSPCNNGCSSKAVSMGIDDIGRVEVLKRCQRLESVFPIFDDCGKLRKVICIVKGAGEQGKTEAADKSEELSDAGDMALSMIYHDLASPLQVIKASLDVMEMELERHTDSAFERICDMLKAAKRSERRLSEMVRSIRSVPALRDRELVVECVRPNAVIEAVCADFRLLVKEGVTLEWNLPPEQPDIIVERSLLDRVFFNLLDNAARYTHPGGRIVVSAHYKAGDKDMLFNVFDDGDVIPSDVLARVFQENTAIEVERLRSARRSHGLGLQFCQLVIEKFSGRIWAESRKDWGTQFSFTLPVVLSAMFFTNDWSARNRES
ncbi:PAS domain-containing protein [Candidatus Poribacteria bacterium]|nr:PAS domain-containing protein [Candidatus Poribacteria bacterium]